MYVTRLLTALAPYLPFILEWGDVDDRTKELVVRVHQLATSLEARLVAPEAEDLRLALKELVDALIPILPKRAGDGARGAVEMLSVLLQFLPRINPQEVVVVYEQSDLDHPPELI